MAIIFDTANCKDFQKYFPDQGPEDDRQWNALFYALTLTMLFIGPPTEKDIEEFWTRVNIYQHVVGPLAFRTGPDGKLDVYITEEQAKSLAGLKINISPVSKATFNKKLVSILRNEHKCGYLNGGKR